MEDTVRYAAEVRRAAAAACARAAELQCEDAALRARVHARVARERGGSVVE